MLNFLKNPSHPHDHLFEQDCDYSHLVGCPRTSTAEPSSSMIVAVTVFSTGLLGSADAAAPPISTLHFSSYSYWCHLPSSSLFAIILILFIINGGVY